MSNSAVIYRYELSIGGDNPLLLLSGFEILSVAPSRIDPYKLDLWVRVVPSRVSTEEKVVVPVYPTGGQFVDEDARFIGTAVNADGTVWHAFWKRVS